MVGYCVTIGFQKKSLRIPRVTVWLLCGYCAVTVMLLCCPSHHPSAI